MVGHYPLIKDAIVSGGIAIWFILILCILSYVRRETARNGD